MSALNAKQARFVAEYLKDLNATQAAIRAGYSEKTAHSQGPRLLEHVGIQKALDESMQRRADRVEVKADDILRELMRLAMVDIGGAFNEHGSLRPLHEMPEDVRRAIAGIDVRVDEDGDVVKKVKFWDKTKGLEMLGRHLGLFKDRLEVSADFSFADILKAARERANAKR